MRRIAGIAVAGLLLTGSVTACGKLDGAARSVKDAAAEATPSAARSADTDPATDPAPSATTRTPSRTPATTRRPTSVSPSPSRPVTAADVPNLAVPELLSLARDAADDVRTVHVRATIRLTDVPKMLIDATVDRQREDFTGSATTDQYQLLLTRKGGDVWIKGDERYWLVTGAGRVSAERAKLLATKYLRTSDTDPTVSGLVEGIIAAADPAYALHTVSDRSTKLPLQRFESWQVIPVQAANGDTAYINAGLPAYPIRLITSGVEPEADNYDRFDEPVTVTPPPAEEVVDVEQLG
ncbi:hypothetical protein LO772_08765 [Yinghuangia sp. ASG 101]|uniref:hypothetical protein n=1 Tax=Yinghuangia sp. ASG 101 TaxID=2896848 RepID=UPI001E4651DC|nr:hypothetical protein [Yinghuangia sp. ASG 101]UGQ13671.1 hypothetical protein LO772_08765 [Yinghuangia sp. ASG 101]